MICTRENVLKLDLFGQPIAADTRRTEFNYANESLMLQGIRPDALFIGDSITHLWELQAYFGSTGKIVINRGIGGDTSTYVRKRFTADALQLRPQLIVMKIGTNDLGWLNEQLDDAVIGMVCENIDAMSKEAARERIPLALCSVLPIWGPSWYPVTAFTRRKNEHIVTLNGNMHEIARARGAIYVDYHSHLVDEHGEMPHALADDGVHPHHAGYAIMARVLRETLREHGISL